MNYRFEDVNKVKMVLQLAKAGFSEDGCVYIIDSVEAVDQNTSGSGIKYLGDDVFLMYDYPPAEDWLRKDCTWQHQTIRLGNSESPFDLIIFTEPKASVEFKLRWGRELIERKVSA